MLRKLSLVAIAAASLGAAALAPTSASAWGGWHHGGWHHGWGWGGPRVFIGGPAYAYGGGGCYARRLVATPAKAFGMLIDDRFAAGVAAPLC